MSIIPKPEILTSADPTVTRIIPALAEEIGLNESIVLLQIGFWIKQSTQYIDGHWWTYQSSQDMKDKAFTYWSISTINRILNKLVEDKLLIEAHYNQKKYDRTRWFALNIPNLAKLKSITLKDQTVINVVTETQDEFRQTQNEQRGNQNEQRQTQNEKPIPETPIETPKKKKEKDSVASDDALAQPAIPTLKVVTTSPPIEESPPADSLDSDSDKQRSKDIAAIIKIHLDTGYNDLKPGTSYQNKTKRLEAARILDMGFTPEDVQAFATHLKKRDYWADKSIPLSVLRGDIEGWSRRRSAEADDPLPPSYERYIAPDDDEPGPFYQHVQIMTDMLQDVLDMDRMIHA